MKRRPWPIVIMALFQIFAPLANLALNAGIAHVSIAQYFITYWHSAAWWDLMGFFLALPLAGVATFMIKGWSYPIFFAVTAATLISNIQVLSQYSSVIGKPVIFLAIFSNLSLLIYFLIPSVRAAYFNQRLRWWESAPRFEVNLNGVVEVGNESFPCKITNISKGGAFAEVAKKLTPGETVKVLFSVLSHDVNVPAKIIFHEALANRGYGFQFVHDRQTEKSLKRITRAFTMIGMKTRNDSTPWQVSFVQWFKKLMTTGRGLFPEIPVEAKKTK